MLDVPATPKFTWKDEILPLAMVAATWALTAYFWPHLPARVPTHWGIDGKPNGWMPMPWGAIVGPLIGTGVYLLLTLVPFIDPRRAHWATTMTFYPALKTTLMAFFAGITYLALAAAASPAHQLGRQGLFVAIGLLFLVLGNYLPKVRSNWFVGVRTPWTLSNDEVWARTNRVTGRLFMAAGVAIAACGGLAQPWPLIVMVVTIGGITAFAILYSWWLYNRLTAS